MPSWIVGVSTSVIFPCTIKIQKIMVGKSMIIGYYPVGAPTCLRKQEVGKPSQNAAQSCAEAEGCVHDDLRADKLRKGWGFQVGTWNADSLTGRAGNWWRRWRTQKWMWDVFKKRDEAVAAGSLKLKARGISCSDGVGMFVAEK